MLVWNCPFLNEDVGFRVYHSFASMTYTTHEMGVSGVLAIWPGGHITDAILGLFHSCISDLYIVPTINLL